METKHIPHYLKVGAKDKNWYADCQHLFEDLFGAERLTLVANLFAATSINSSLKSNIRLFRKALHDIENNLPFSNYLPVMLMQLERIRKGDSIQGRKITSFAAAMSGNADAVVVDIWLMRAFGLESLRPTGKTSGVSNKHYDLIELYCRELAVKEGLQAREVSSMIWSGVRITFTGDKETHYRNILRHQLFNMFETVKA